MKKAWILLLTLVFCLAMTGCPEKNEQHEQGVVETDSQGRPTKKNILSSSGEILEVEAYTYNEEGRKSQIITYDPQGTEIKRAAYTYDSNGFVHTVDTVFAAPLEGSNITRDLLEYGEDRSWARILSYDADGVLVQEQYDEFDVHSQAYTYSRTTVYQDGAFDFCAETVYNEDGTQIDRSLREDGSVVMESLYQEVEDQSWICIREVEYYEDGGICTLSEWIKEEEANKITEYDEDGQLWGIRWQRIYDEPYRVWLPLKNGEFVECETPSEDLYFQITRGGYDDVATWTGYDLLDQNGNIRKSMEYDTETGMPTYHREWDADGVMTKGVDYFDNGKIAEEFFCNADGKINALCLYNRSGEVVFRYDCKGTTNYISHGSNNLTGERMIWLYSSEGVCLERSSFRNGIPTKRELFSGDRRSIGVDLYNDNGEVCTEIRLMGDTDVNKLGIVDHEDGSFHVWEYNGDGNPIGYQIYDTDWKLMAAYIAQRSDSVGLSWTIDEDGGYHFYEYDADGNMYGDY